MTTLRRLDLLLLLAQRGRHVVEAVVRAREVRLRALKRRLGALERAPRVRARLARAARRRVAGSAAVSIIFRWIRPMFICELASRRRYSTRPRPDGDWWSAATDSAPKS